MKCFGASTGPRCGCQRAARLVFLSARYLPHLRCRLQTTHALEGLGAVPCLGGVGRPTTCGSVRCATTSDGGARRGELRDDGLRPPLLLAFATGLTMCCPVVQAPLGRNVITCKTPAVIRG